MQVITSKDNELIKTQLNDFNKKIDGQKETAEAK